MKNMKLIVPLFVIASVAATSAFATVDISPITTAQATLVTYGGALLALGIAVWAIMKVVRMFGGK